MKSLRWYAILSSAAVLFSVTAGAQLQKGSGRGGGNPPQSGGGSPPQSGGGREAPPKPRENPPQSGGGREAPPKPRENPPQSGGGREAPPKPRENPPQSGGGRETPPKPREIPSNPPSQGGGRENPITRGGNPPFGGGRENPNSNPPVRGGGGPTGIRQGSDQLGRIPRNGAGGYGGSVSNSNNGRNKVNPITIQNLPSSQSLASQVLREDNPRKRGNIYDNWRSGYYHYYNDWCDDYFWCNRYVFNPWQTRCVVSPWYYYHSLPGYLNYNCIRIISLPIYVWRGNDYRYSRYDTWGNRDYYRDRTDLDYTIDDIVKAFERQDKRALGRLISSRDRVHIYSNGNYDYSLDAADFYDLMLDGIYNSQTRRYEIESVETYRDEAEVVARHEYTDPWGRRTSVYHWYHLEQDRNGYVITKFGTSDRNCW